MIKNERQYRITRAQAEKFKAALAHAREISSERTEMHPLLLQAQVDALRSQLEDLEADVREYEALREGKHKVLRAESIDDLPRVLIQARIALGLSHKDLADRLELKEQQVQRYEATDYASASISKIQQVVRALGIQVREEVILPEVPTSFADLLRPLKEFGLSKDFVVSRLLPRTLAAQLEVGARGEEGESEPSGLLLQAAAAIGRVFDWKPGALLSGATLQLDPARIGGARFKKLAKGEERRAAAYTVYAHYLAMLTLGATAELRPKRIPDDPAAFRDAVLHAYGDISFHHVLLFLWDIGVPVLPLSDPGAFHGACWRVEGRNVIVLKQRTNSLARWLFDLLHETDHVAKRPTSKSLAIIEPGMSTEELQVTEELEASAFAGEVMLSCRSEELAQLCVDAARGSVERLATVVPQIALRENVEVGALANYMAYRLALQGINWWGAATNLQRGAEDPLAIARDVLVTKADLGRLNPIDRDLLMQALSPVT
jgi:ribosome-binding protein aMBF1 (putative translation factor)